MLFLIATIIILIAFLFQMAKDAKYWMKEAHKYKDLYYESHISPERFAELATEQKPVSKEERERIRKSAESIDRSLGRCNHLCEKCIELKENKPCE